MKQGDNLNPVLPWLGVNQHTVHFDSYNITNNNQHNWALNFTKDDGT